jgi:hypothetical protein
VRRGCRALLAALLALGLAGCAVSGLEFVSDNRVTLLAPKSLALVKLPVTLRWAIKHFTLAAPGRGQVSPDVGYFAIFVDQAPIRPGQTLRAVAAGDPSCLHSPGCPNATYLANHQVYTTTSTEFTLSQVASLNDYQSVQLHEVTIVLMNTAGHRIGESAWYIDFRLRQELF